MKDKLVPYTEVRRPTVIDVFKQIERKALMKYASILTDPSDNKGWKLRLESVGEEMSKERMDYLAAEDPHRQFITTVGEHPITMVFKRIR